MEPSYLAEIERLKHELYLEAALQVAFAESNQVKSTEEPEVKGLFNGLKRFWNEIQAVYDPRLVAVSDHGIIVEWIDERTGERPWFS